MIQLWIVSGHDGLDDANVPDHERVPCEKPQAKAGFPRPCKPV